MESPELLGRRIIETLEEKGHYNGRVTHDIIRTLDLLATHRRLKRENATATAMMLLAYKRYVPDDGIFLSKVCEVRNDVLKKYLVESLPPNGNNARSIARLILGECIPHLDGGSWDLRDVWYVAEPLLDCWRHHVEKYRELGRMQALFNRVNEDRGEPVIEWEAATGTETFKRDELLEIDMMEHVWPQIRHTEAGRNNSTTL